MVFYSWDTKKIKDGFRWNVTKMTPLKKPNKQGQYIKTIVIKTGIKKTRPQASGIARRWKLYMTQQERRRSK